MINATDMEDFYFYDKDDKKKIYEHVVKYFGEVDTYYSAKENDLIQADLCIIKPKKNKDYYTVVTIGMGSYKMTVPHELEDMNIQRAEVVIYLPSSWSFDSSNVNYIWPLQMIKTLTTFALMHKTFLAYSHVINCKTPFSHNTYLQGVVLSYLKLVDKKANTCLLDTDEVVNFYQLIPLYKEEIDFKDEFGAEALMKKILPLSPIVDINRKCLIDRNYVISYDEKEHSKKLDTINSIYDIDDLDFLVDHVYTHQKNIYDKKLNLDEISALNHIAIILRYFIEHDLMSDEFKQNNQELYTLIQDNNFDFRYYVKYRLKSRIDLRFFNEDGYYLMRYCEGAGDFTPSVFAEIDNNALEYFGFDRYRSSEFKDEAYLFVPYDENYYKAMQKYLDKHFKSFKDNMFNIDTEDNEIAQAIIFMCIDDNKRFIQSKFSKSENINKCKYFPAFLNDDVLTSALSYKRRSILRDGVFTFVFDVDATLLERTLQNMHAYSPGAKHNINNVALRQYQKLCKKNSLNKKELYKEAEDFLDNIYTLKGDIFNKKELTLKDVKEILKDDLKVFSHKNKKELLSFDRAKRILDSSFVSDNLKKKDGEGIRDYCILTVKHDNPAFIFLKYDVSVPNSILDRDNLIALTSYFYDKYTAYPIYIGPDYVEFCVDLFVGEKALDLALDLYTLDSSLVKKHIKEHKVNLPSLLKEIVNLKHFRVKLDIKY